MKIFAIALAIFGFAATIGELAYVKFFAGEDAGKYKIYDRDQSSSPPVFKVREDDLPVRVNMKIYGWRNKYGGFSKAQLNLNNGQQGSENAIKWTIHPDEEDDYKPLSISIGPITFSGRGGYTRIEQSRLFEAATPGEWELALVPENENRYELHRVEAKVRYNSRTMNVWVIVAGIIAVFAGCIMYQMISSKGR